MLLNNLPPPPTQKFPYPGGVIKFSISCVFSPKKIFPLRGNFAYPGGGLLNDERYVDFLHISIKMSYY